MIGFIRDRENQRSVLDLLKVTSSTLLSQGSMLRFLIMLTSSIEVSLEVRFGFCLCPLATIRVDLGLQALQDYVRGRSPEVPACFPVRPPEVFVEHADPVRRVRWPQMVTAERGRLFLQYSPEELSAVSQLYFQ